MGLDTLSSRWDIQIENSNGTVKGDRYPGLLFGR